MPSRIFFGNPTIGPISIDLDPVVVEVVRPAVMVEYDRTFDLATVVVNVVVITPLESAREFGLAPVVVHIVSPAGEMVLGTLEVDLNPVVVKVVTLEPSTGSTGVIGETHAYFANPAGVPAGMPVLLKDYQIDRYANRVGTWSLMMPVDNRIVSGTTPLSSLIRSGWHVRIVEEGFSPLDDTALALMDDGIVEGREYQLDDDGEGHLLRLTGSFAEVKLAKEQIHEKLSFPEGTPVQAIANSLAGGPISIPAAVTTVLEVDFNEGSRLAAEWKLGELARLTWRREWDGSLAFVQVDAAPDSGWSFRNIDVAPQAPAPGGPRVGYIAAKPGVVYDGTGIVNWIAAFGVDSDGGNLTLEHADTTLTAYPVLHEGDRWIIKDQASIDLYGLSEAQIYRTDVKSPARNTDTKGAASRVLTIAVQPTVGDTFTIGSRTYTFVTNGAARSTGEIWVGTDAGSAANYVLSALNGWDGVNAVNTDVFVNVTAWPDLILVATALGAAGNGLTTTSSFTSGSNGFDLPATSGGSFAVATANTLYATTVNELLKARSEIFGLRVQVHRGNEVWALPGDRVRVEYTGAGVSEEAAALGILAPVPWLTVAEWMVVVERHDKSSSSGVRAVEWVLACPVLQYPVPALPTWTDPVALPIPDTLTVPRGGENFPTDPWKDVPYPDPAPPTVPDTVPTGGGDLPKALNKILTNNKLPFDPCCPDSTTDVGSGGALPPETDVPMFIGFITGEVIPAGQAAAEYNFGGPNNPATLTVPIFGVGPHTIVLVRALLWGGPAGGGSVSVSGADLSVIGTLSGGGADMVVYAIELSAGQSATLTMTRPAVPAANNLRMGELQAVVVAPAEIVSYQTDEPVFDSAAVVDADQIAVSFFLYAEESAGATPTDPSPIGPGGADWTNSEGNGTHAFVGHLAMGGVWGGVVASGMAWAPGPFSGYNWGTAGADFDAEAGIVTVILRKAYP